MHLHIVGLLVEPTDRDWTHILGNSFNWACIDPLGLVDWSILTLAHFQFPLLFFFRIEIGDTSFVRLSREGNKI